MPIGVCIAKAHDSAILWVTLINSIISLFNLIDSPGLIGIKLVLDNISCSFNLLSTKPIVSLVPYTGIFICFNI